MSHHYIEGEQDDDREVIVRLSDQLAAERRKNKRLKAECKRLKAKLKDRGMEAL